MKALIKVHGHKFSVRNGSLYVDGALLDVPLKSALFGSANTENIGGKRYQTKIGKNVFVIDDKGFNINGQAFSYEDVAKLQEQNGIVDDSKIHYSYTFADVEVVENRGSRARDYMEFKAPKEAKAPTKNNRFRVFSVGTVTQVGSVQVNNYTHHESQSSVGNATQVGSVQVNNYTHHESQPGDED